MRLTKFVSILLLTVVAFACSDNKTKDIDHEGLSKAEEEQLKAYVKDNNITEAPTSSGLYYIKLEDGNGEKPAMGEKVNITYKGMFLSGKVFDEGKFDFAIGAGGLIEGFKEGLQLMEYDEKAKFIIPSGLAYGPYGQYPIPPYTTLLFELSISKIDSNN
ncbi:hypothetical protein EMN47_02795 [Prolixibacteraceae bacterium JC049]|nr:hypothetical protein [Prolixibacteraceae bacterium JC049]